MLYVDLTEDEKKKYDSLSASFYADLKTWLGKENIQYLIDRKDNLLSIHIIGGGMEIRNWMRSYSETKDWDCYTLDDLWIPIILKLIE